MPYEYFQGILGLSRNTNELEVLVKEDGHAQYVNADTLGNSDYELVAVVKQQPGDSTSNDVGIFKRWREK